MSGVISPEEARAAMTKASDEGFGEEEEDEIPDDDSDTARGSDSLSNDDNNQEYSF